MIDLVWLIPALPLLGFCVLLLTGKRIGEPTAGYLATAMTGGSFLLGVAVFADLVTRNGEERQITVKLFDWLKVGQLDVGVTALVDPLSITMVLFVTGIGTLIHLYAIGYMHGDSRFSRFFTYLNLFIFSMLCLVLADNFVLMFLGWEGVGACSYLLVSFWFEKDSAATAGKKAFVVNRVGDFGLMIGMFILFNATGALTYLGVFDVANAGGITRNAATAAALMLFLGACGKSAQLPLYVWLPDAMEGPTPVSALIHAATMVTAGVYLMMRCFPLLSVADPIVFTVIAWTGGLTALFAATIAVAQDDIKKILAYSTISQLGYMFLAIGMHANAAAAFHMITHAFFKALMFLGAGSVIHGMHNEQDVKRMGNLRKWMPITFFTYLAGWLAIAGVPPLSGFWSKDEILLSAYEGGALGVTGAKVLWVLGLITALLTAYYMSRQVFLVFFGKERFLHSVGAGIAPLHADADAAHDDKHANGPVTPHESPWQMTVPLVVLAGLAVVGGAMNLPFTKSLERLAHWLEPSVGSHEFVSSGSTKIVLAVIATACGLVGIFIARMFWLQRPIESNASLEPVLLKRAYGVDSIYSSIFEKPGLAISAMVAGVLDGKLIEGVVNGTGSLVKVVGGNVRKAQTGFVRNYALVIAFGAVALLTYALVRTL
jgi:NADH-quinone oxidoreductase subunit L